VSNQLHPITPPEELLDHCCAVGRAGNWHNALTLAYRAGADQELEASCEWLLNTKLGRQVSQGSAPPAAQNYHPKLLKSMGSRIA